MVKPPSKRSKPPAAAKTAAKRRRKKASATAAAEGAFHAALEDVTHTSDTYTPTFPAEWESERQEVIRLLRDLPHALQDAEKALRWLEETRPAGFDRFVIGGNQLPEEPEIATETTLAGGSLLSLLRLDQVLVAPIQYVARGLWRVKGWIGGGLAWLADNVASGLVRGAASLVVFDNAEMIRHQLIALEARLTAIVGPIKHLLTLLKDLF